MRRLLFISVLLMLLFSCQQEPLHDGNKPGREEAEMQQRQIELTFRLGAGATKASIPVDNSNAETKVTNLAVIARPVKSDVESSWKKSLVTVFDTPLDWNSSTEVSGKVNAYVGNNVFYVLVNYTDAMLDFVNDQAVGAGKGLRVSRESAFSPVLTESTFGEKQLELKDMFFSETRGYTMMAKCTYAGNSQVLVTPNATGLTLDGELHRMLAQVHMAFDHYEHAPDQAVVLGYLDDHVTEIPSDIRVVVGDGYGSQAGWVPLSSIRYCLNAVNTKVFLEADDNCNVTTFYPEDPNYLLEDTIEPSGADWAYKSGYENDFLYWDPNDAATLFADPLTPQWMAEPPNSLYCLENTVFSDTFLSDFDINTSYRRFAPRRATTHLLVEVQFTPRYIIVGRDGSVDRNHIYKGFTNRDAAIAILKDNEHLSEPGDGTFWTPDLKHFYNWDGVKAEIDYSHDMHTADPSYRRLTQEDFVKYPQGKCYYAAYISGDTATDPDTERNYLTFGEGKSSVRRDASYTLTARVLRVPSISTSMMELNTTTTSSLVWPDRDGSGSIEIKPQ